MQYFTSCCIYRVDTRCLPLKKKKDENESIIDDVLFGLCNKLSG